MARRTVDAGQASFDARARRTAGGAPALPTPNCIVRHEDGRRVRFVFLFAATTRHRASSVHAAWTDSLLRIAAFARRFCLREIADPLCRHERKRPLVWTAGRTGARRQGWPVGIAARGVGKDARGTSRFRQNARWHFYTAARRRLFRRATCRVGGG